MTCARLAVRAPFAASTHARLAPADRRVGNAVHARAAARRRGLPCRGAVPCRAAGASRDAAVQPAPPRPFAPFVGHAGGLFVGEVPLDLASECVKAADVAGCGGAWWGVHHSFLC